jgi:hypothetical protein
MSTLSLMPPLQSDKLLNAFLQYAAEVDGAMRDICGCR